MVRDWDFIDDIIDAVIEKVVVTGISNYTDATASVDHTEADNLRGTIRKLIEEEFPMLVI